MIQTILFATPFAMLAVGAASDVPPWLDAVSRVGVVGVLALALFGLYRKWWVPGWAYRELEERHKKLSDRYDVAIDTALRASQGVVDTASAIDGALTQTIQPSKPRRGG